MARKGFTLAEVLITLGIIGVVAALTTPALIQNVGDAKIGPSLLKAKSAFETASEMLLNDKDFDNLLALGSHATDIGNALQNYMKISYNSTKYEFECNQTGVHTSQELYDRYDSEGGMTYWIMLYNGAPLDVAEGYNSSSPTNMLIGLVAVDINGEKAPNRSAKDVFLFLLYNDGTLRPYGGLKSNRSIMAIMTWKDNGNCDGESSVNDPRTCTGSIFDNGMKVIYDYSPQPLTDEPLF